MTARTLSLNCRNGKCGFCNEMDCPHSCHLLSPFCKVNAHRECNGYNCRCKTCRHRERK